MTRIKDTSEDQVFTEIKDTSPSAGVVENLQIGY